MSVYEILELIFLPLLIVALLALPVYAAITKKKSGTSTTKKAVQKATKSATNTITRELTRSILGNLIK